MKICEVVTISFGMFCEVVTTSFAKLKQEALGFFYEVLTRRLRRFGKVQQERQEILERHDGNLRNFGKMNEKIKTFGNMQLKDKIFLKYVIEI